MLAEASLIGYALFGAWLVAAHSGWLSAVFMLLYAASFATVVGVSLWQDRSPQRLKLRAGAARLRTGRPRSEQA